MSVYNGAIAKKEVLDMQAAKLLSLPVAVALIVSLTGCGAGGSTKITQAAQAPQTASTRRTRHLISRAAASPHRAAARAMK